MPLTSTKFVTVTLVAAESVIAPVESKSALPAVFTPTMFVPESSLIAIAAVELNVKLPKFVVSVGSSPSACS